jgi:integrase/recombinase XerC
VLVGAGLRAAEAVGLDMADVREDGGGTVLHIRQGTGRTDRTVPIRADLSRLIQQHLRANGRRLGDDGPLFTAHDRGSRRRGARRLSTRSVDAIVARTCAQAGIDATAILSTSLRHTMAIRSLRAGVNVVAVSKLLGHASVSTTQKYLDHMALDELRAAVPALPVVTAG